MQFKTPNIEDKIWVDEIIQKTENEQLLLNCDVPFATNFLWKKMYNIKIGRYKDFIVKSFGNEEDTINYSYPLGVGDEEEVIKEMILFAFKNDKKVLFSGVSKEQAKVVNQVYGGTLKFEENRDYAEYIYLSDDLANLAGRKYHSKRNHISKFMKMYNYSFEQINKDNAKDAIEVAQKWCNSNGLGDNNGLTHEFCAIKNAFKYYDELQLVGGILRIDGQAVAMTVGEKVSKDTFVVHFEKAVDGFNGLYTVVNQLFAKTLTQYKYINREEDLGIEGLRKAKLSYKPTILTQEFTSSLLRKQDGIL